MALTLDGTGGLTLPSWTTAGRPATPQNGQMGINTTLGYIEWYDSASAAWVGAFQAPPNLVTYLVVGGGGGGGQGKASICNGAGGAGLVSGISGANVTYAGGGAGGHYAGSGGSAAGGAGGGGNGGKSGTGITAGTANTGGGGGGYGNTGFSGASGGSGIVIIRYASAVQKGTGGTVTTYSSGGVTYWVHTFTGSGTFTA